MIGQQKYRSVSFAKNSWSCKWLYVSLLWRTQTCIHTSSQLICVCKSVVANLFGYFFWHDIIRKETYRPKKGRECPTRHRPPENNPKGLRTFRSWYFLSGLDGGLWREPIDFDWFHVCRIIPLSCWWCNNIRNFQTDKWKSYSIFQIWHFCHCFLAWGFHILIKSGMMCL